ncbi:MAG TPA: sulfite exporter TauE/SafE family protein [Polyangiaceae bacterium]|jgi:hypothetical protein
MNAGLLVPVVVASVLGSVHCAAMCGGLVAASSAGTSSGASRFGTSLAYNAARLTSYVALGAIAGGLGRAVDLAGKAAGVAHVAAVVAGLTMMGWGLWAMLETQGVRLGKLRVRTPSVFSGLFARLHARPPLVRALLLGGASALLPCGWLYAFVLSAAGTGSAWNGAAVMAAFWAGNAPMLLGLGVLLSGVLSRVRSHVPLLSAAAILSVGLYTVVSRASLPAFALPGLAGASTTLPSSAHDCPCHRKH